MAELRTARVTGIRVTPSSARRLDAASCPTSTSPRDRIEVRFSGAQEAVGRLFALAQALTHDYEQFEALVGGEPGAAGERRGHERRSCCELTDIAPRPAQASAELVLPAVIVDAGPAAVERFLEFFAARIANASARGRRMGGPWGSSWRGARRGAWGSRRSRRCTWRPTSGPTPGRRPPSSSTWRPSACSATGSSSARFSR